LQCAQVRVETTANALDVLEASQVLFTREIPDDGFLPRMLGSNAEFRLLIRLEL
jgi:hypothetical protein